jgi:D-alanyl-lipoteichoic acid acyltransferase DltB (MBOAT superfamily)
MRERPQLLPFLAYFFILPNYFSRGFPTIDFQTMRRTYYGRDIHLIAQQGIQWMARGAIQIMLYRLVLYLKDPYIEDNIDTLGKLALLMVLNVLLYLIISGHYHFVIGMLHLFGYDLPETNHRYLLATSFTDFWRRINIYWKDFMMKVFFFPVYFKLRKSGEVKAQAAATAAAFGASCILHVYQLFWWSGQWEMSPQAITFWAMFGLAVFISLVYEKRRKRRPPQAGWRNLTIRAAQVAATISCIAILRLLYDSASFGAWYYTVTHWARAGR